MAMAMWTSVARSASLKAGDFNGDGFKDLAAGNGEFGGIAFHWNKGDGTFSSREVYGRGKVLGTLSAADLDGDRDQDLVSLEVVSQGEAVVVMRNPGDGKLIVEPKPAIQGFFSFLTTADMDEDLKQDLILANASGIVVCFSAGDGSFPRRTKIEAFLGSGPVSPADLDGDGDLDLALNLNTGASVAWARNEGGGNFGPATPVSVEGLPGFLGAADLDGDRDQDLLVSTEKGAQILENDGKGNFTPGKAIDLGLAPTSLVAADFDGNGNLDLAASGFSGCPDACDSSQLSVTLNDGHGGLDRPSFYKIFERASTLLVSDLDLDGDLDLVVVAGAISNRVFLNNGKGTFSLWGVLAGSGYSVAGLLLNSVAVQDLDGDQYPEIAMTTGYGDGVTILRNLTTPPLGTDNDGNGVLDDCETAVFRRGDWNQDGQFNLSDAISLVDYLFRGGERFPCTKAGDADDSGRLNITDPIRIVLHLFRGGAAPAAPFPACGKDLTGDSLSSSGRVVQRPTLRESPKRAIRIG